jgi:Na+-driven multidrug efflux pump
MLIYYITNRNGVRMKGIGIATELIGPMVKVGFSVMLMMALMAIQQVFLLRTIGEIGGEDQLIVLGATLRLFTFLPIMAKGVAEGMQPLVGMSTGAGDGERARKALERFTFLGPIAVLVPYAVLMLFPEQVLGAFITDAAILAEGYGHFRLFFSTFVLQVALFTVNYYFIAIGKGKEAGMLVMCRQLFIFVPVTLLLGELMGIIGVWAAVPVCDLLAIALSYMMMKKELSPTVVTFREVAPS